MPNRIIRESALTSATLYRLSDGAERLFWRMTLVADDFGRFEADTQVLKSKCFPLWPDAKMPAKRVIALYRELEMAELIGTYVVSGKHYGHFITWEKYQQRRAASSKFPDPAPDNACPHTDVGGCMRLRADSLVFEIESRESRSESRSGPPGSALAAPAVEFKVPQPILDALNRSPKLGKTGKVYEPTYWQAIFRAYPGVNYPAVILDAETYLATHRYSDLASFLRNSVKRAFNRGGQP